MTDARVTADPDTGSAFDTAGTTAASHAPSQPGATTLPDGVRLWLIRHGETEWSKAGRHTGRTDLPLTEAGEAQARALRPLLEADPPTWVMCSPRTRAQQTAQLSGLTVNAIDDDLSEWDYGDYEGLTGAQIGERVPGWNLWSDGVTGGESIEQVSTRADAVIARATEHLRDGTVAIVAHGHISRVLAARWLGLDPSAGRHFLLGTAAPSVLSMQYGDRCVARWNIPVSTTRTEAP
jgi:broad specificity phosphatase PhoE